MGYSYNSGAFPSRGCFFFGLGVPGGFGWILWQECRINRRRMKAFFPPGGVKKAGYSGWEGIQQPGCGGLLCWGGVLLGLVLVVWAAEEVRGSQPPEYPSKDGITPPLEPMDVDSNSIPEAPWVEVSPEGSVPEGSRPSSPTPSTGNSPVGGDMASSSGQRPPDAVGDPADASAQMVVEVRVLGRQHVPWSKLAPLIRTRAGRPLDMELIEEDVRRLNRSRLFVSVRTWMQPVQGGQVVIFEVVERPVLQYVKFVGNEKVRKKVLAEKAGLKPGDALDPFAVEEGRRKIEDYYRSHGFSNARVTIIEGNQPDDKGAIFLVNEGQKQRILWTRFEGNTVATDARLRTQIHSKPGFLWIIRGQVDRKEIEEDINRLKAYYASLGYFNAKIGREVEYLHDKNWIILTFVIDEGPRYKVREIRFVGHQRFSDQELAETIQLKQGQYFNQAQLQSDVAALQEKYGAIGYVFADIKPDIRYLPEPGQADLVYEIKEGDRYRVGRIDVKIGSEEVSPHTKITTVLNRLSLAPGDVVDIRELRASERRLRASGLFLIDPVRNIQPKIVFSPPDVSDEELEVAQPQQPTVRGQNPSGSQEGASKPAGPMPGPGFPRPIFPERSSETDQADSVPDPVGRPADMQASRHAPDQERFGVLSVYGQFRPEAEAYLRRLEKSSAPANPPATPPMPEETPEDGGQQAAPSRWQERKVRLPSPVGDGSHSGRLLGSQWQPSPCPVQQSRSQVGPSAGSGLADPPSEGLSPSIRLAGSEKPTIVRGQSPVWGEEGGRIVPGLPESRPLPGMERFYQIGPSQATTAGGSGTPPASPTSSATGYPSDTWSRGGSRAGYAQTESAPAGGAVSGQVGGVAGQGIGPTGQPMVAAPAAGYPAAPGQSLPGGGAASGPAQASPYASESGPFGGFFRRWIGQRFLGGGVPESDSYGAPSGGILGGQGGLFSGQAPGQELQEPPLRPLPLQVITEESRTGRIMLGVGVTSDAGVVGSVIVDEQNFDIFRFPHSWEEIRNGTAWRGAGQRFRLEAVPGTQVHRYLISFTEPYFLDTEISTGVSGYFFKRIYRDWREERLGGTVRLGYQFRPDLTANFTFRGERVTLFEPSVGPGLVPDLDAALGTHELFGFRLGLAYDTRDNAFLPTEGHYIDFGVEQVVGSFQYPRGDVEIRKYFTLHQRADGSGRHVLSVGVSFAVTGKDTPIYDHYFAGGFSTLRGFDYREAGPHIAGVSVGGHTQLLTSAQYMFPVTADDMLRLVLFCDAGTVEEDYTLRDENFRVALGFGLRVLVPAMGPAPLAFDFAWPVSKGPDDVTEVFSFFIGIGR